MVRVTAGELQKQFGAYSETAQREPVTITKHGRDSLVLISAAAYERLKAIYAPKAYHVSEAPEEFIRALETAKAPEWTKMYDHEIDED
jgi:prevent-host-death family protein